MPTPRHFPGAPRAILAALFSLCFLFYGSQLAARPQQASTVISADTAKAIDLYRQGKTKEAIAALRQVVKERKTDAIAWHYLGLSLARDSKEKEARKAFESAVKLDPSFATARVSWAFMLLLADKNNDAAREAAKALTLDPKIAEAHYILGVTYMRAGDYNKSVEAIDAALLINPNYANALLLKSQALVGAPTEGAFVAEQKETASLRKLRFKEAAASLEKYLQLNPEAAKSGFWRDQLETLRFYSSDASTPERTTFSPSAVNTKARILSRKEPSYTDRARKAGVEGRVVLRAVLAADGQVKYIYVLKGLEYGLTEAAVKAARAIKFVPAMKDGRPVSQYVQIEYDFNLY